MAALAEAATSAVAELAGLQHRAAVEVGLELGKIVAGQRLAAWVVLAAEPT